MAQRIYASISDYQPVTGQTAPAELTRQSFAAASRRVDRALIGAVYDVDDDGMPTKPDIVDAFREATCAVVEAWVDAGDPTGTGQTPQYGTVTIGDVTLSRGGGRTGGSPGGPDLPQKALDVLYAAELLPIDPYASG